MNRWTGLLLLLGACAAPEETAAPAPPAVAASRAKGGDGPGDPERRAKFLAGSSASGAAVLVETNNPANLDAVAAFFVDPGKPYAERLTTLAALRGLRTQDPQEYARVFPRVRPKLWAEVSHGAGLSMSPENERGFVDAVGWLSDQKDPEARFKMEFHLDRETVKRKRLPDSALCAAVDQITVRAQPAFRLDARLVARAPGRLDHELAPHGGSLAAAAVGVGQFDGLLVLVHG